MPATTGRSEDIFFPIMSEDAGIEPRTVAISALVVRSSNHLARSHPHSARSYPQSARSHPFPIVEIFTR
jgi:hypothetical protein